MLYDVTLPGHAPPTYECPQDNCQAPFQGSFAQTDVDAWHTALQQGADAARAHLRESGAPDIRHTPTCPFRCLPPAVLALCSDDDQDLLDEHDAVWAVLDDC